MNREEQREGYAGTPAAVRATFERARLGAIRELEARLADLRERDWLDFAIDVGAPLVEVPLAARRLSPLAAARVPYLRADPLKHRGAWKIKADSMEWYIDAAALAAAYQDDGDGKALHEP